MKNIVRTLLFIFCPWSAGCFPTVADDDSGGGALRTLKDTLTYQISQEKRGGKPSVGNESWQAYWHAQISEYEAYAHSRGQGNLADLGNEMLGFIRKKRAAAGLPPAE